MVQAGQQNQNQMATQQSGQGSNLTERDFLQLALNESKQLASSINTYVLEANTSQLRRDYLSVLGDVYSQQEEIFSLMQQKGYYNVENANSQQMAKAKNKFSSQQSQ